MSPRFKLTYTSSLIIGIIIAVSVATNAISAATPNYAAKQMVASPPASALDQLEAYRYTIGFKNIGALSWKNEGANTLTIKTTDSVRVEHWFASALWVNKTTVTNLATKEVKPGEIGFFAMTLEAPKRAGIYNNHFALYAGNAKITGTDFSMPITVSKKLASAAKQKINESETTTVAATTLKTVSYITAKPMLRSSESLTLRAGETKEFQIAFKNTGERNWRSGAPSTVSLTLDTQSLNGVNFKDSSWLEENTPTALSLSLVKPGELGFFTFKIKAPRIAGSYQPQFRLVLNGDTLISGSEFRLPITVTEPPPEPAATLVSVPLINSSTQNSMIVCAAALDSTVPINSEAAQQQLSNEPGICIPAHSEPTLRVGLASVQGQLGLTAAAPYAVSDSNGQILMQIDGGVAVFIAFDPINKIYTAVGPGPIITSALPLRVRTINEPSIITLTTFNNPAAYDANLNDNVYRGSIELNWSNNDQKLWIINGLKMEEYLPGLAETSNGSPTEYQKALMVAARTYALYHYETKVKHAARNFDVIATVGDQYYRGYNSEMRTPNVTAAVRATRGQVVTYQDQVVITPYSASSNGTSRAWEDVWGGSPKPWLIRQTIPEDVGRTRFGHAVGLSQLAAADQAKAGKSYVDILKFFYVGTEVSQWY